MQISFEQEDVERAIALYLRSMGITAKVANVSFVAGRKDSGLRTTIDLEDVEHQPIPDQPLKREVLDGVVGRDTSDKSHRSLSNDESSQTEDGGEQETNPLPPETKDEEVPDSDDDAEANESDGTGTKKSIFD